MLQMFEKYLVLREKHKVQPADAGGKDEVSERQSAAAIKLFS